jgi:hypothetical protein
VSTPPSWAVPTEQLTGETPVTTNIGFIDRVVRVIIGITLLALAVTGNVGFWGYIGVIPLATALLGWCPAYSLFGVKTCRTA